MRIRSGQPARDLDDARRAAGIIVRPVKDASGVAPQVVVMGGQQDVLVAQRRIGTAKNTCDIAQTGFA